MEITFGHTSRETFQKPLASEIQWLTNHFTLNSRDKEKKFQGVKDLRHENYNLLNLLQLKRADEPKKKHPKMHIKIQNVINAHIVKTYNKILYKRVTYYNIYKYNYNYSYMTIIDDLVNNGTTMKCRPLIIVQYRYSK